MYSNSLIEASQAALPMQESVRDRLGRNLKGAESVVEDIKRAIELLDKYPEMEELTNLLRRVG